MDTHRAQFDSHRFVKRLTKAGLSEEVAEVLADEHANLIVPADVATKREVAAVSTDVAAVTTGLAAVSTDVAAVSAGLAAVSADVATVSAGLAAVSTDVATVSAGLAAVSTDVATVSAGLAAVSTDLASVRSEMATKADLAECEARMEQRLQNAILEAKISLIKWMIATMMVFSGIVIGAVTALQ